MNYSNVPEDRYDHRQNRHDLVQRNSGNNDYDDDGYHDGDESHEQSYGANQQSPHRNHPHDERYNMNPPEGMEGDAYDVPGYGWQDYRQQTEKDEEEDEDGAGAEDAILDLAELEQLQEEAERMKGLGNKHMAAQEYTRAYNAYSAALQLSPVGPSSHVFLSNRAASLLSLKRYSAAAVDARRAVALAPTFGKAHARLGQALYFLKQYEGAVEAYEDALRFEEADGNGGNSAVTRAYLQKAKEKLARQEEKERRKRNVNSGGGGSGGGFDDGTSVMEESVNPTIAYSIATDKERVGLASGLHETSERVNAAVKVIKPEEKESNQLDLQKLKIHENGELSQNENEEKNPSPLGSPFQSFHNPDSRSSPVFMTVETGPMGGPAQRRVEPPSHPQDRGVATNYGATTQQASGVNVSNLSENQEDEPDPDFDEALRLQRRATHFLCHKQYRHAVDDFSAALFLVPDDPVLTPQLHVGRAHALNGQERFESAKNDALMALKHILREGIEDASAAEAYSVLGKSLYYSEDYQGAMEAFEECDRVWKKNGAKLSVFDEAYLEQCREALDAGMGVDHGDGTSISGGASVSVISVISSVKEGKSLTNIPKLKPPRFVSREQALQQTPNLPPMPKSWPQQSPTSPSSIATGPERNVVFLSDAMGIKLNRGTDGLVRVISVADLPPGSPILRKGKIEVGDLVREAGGVDLRRPITVTMWSDTVALIKMAPRPITIIVAKEITAEVANSPRARRNDRFRFQEV
mmetsp:Transcript_31649/g.67035  ORF Transcript_31649/g.67035 Transcript_31649/m.67035 type:complete len:751 (+) Transcript_31649:122-2374(+)